LPAGYKRLAVMRRGIKLSALVQLAYICVRTLWHSVPFLTGGALPPPPPGLLARLHTLCLALPHARVKSEKLYYLHDCAEDPLTISTEYIFYAGVALFLLRAWAFGFGKANREKLWAIMLYSLLSMLCLSEVGSKHGTQCFCVAEFCSSCCLLCSRFVATGHLFHLPSSPRQVIIIFYMYHVDMKMMGRGAGWQYPQMLAKHFAGRLGLSAATVISIAEVCTAGRQPVAARPAEHSMLPSIHFHNSCLASQGGC
jgi:hypothetical protein